MVGPEEIAHVVHTLVLEIGITVLVGAVLSYIFHTFKLPLILAYLATGVVIGANVGFGFVESEVGLSGISEIGLVLLLFMIGLEIDLNKLKAAGPSLVSTGIFQFLISASLGFGFFLLFGYGMGGGSFDLFYLAIGTAISSTAVVVKLLYSKSELDTLSGRLTVGILIFQDIWAIVILGLLPSLADPHILEILKSFGLMALMISLAISFSKFVLPSLFKRIAKSPELIIITSLGWCVAVCGVAMKFGLSVEMGALIAGIGMSTFPYTLDVEAKLTQIRDVLIMLFFVSLGMKIPNPFADPSILLIAASASMFVVFARTISIFPFLKALKNGNRVGLLTSLNLSNVSEFSLVIAAIGIRQGHIGNDILAILIFTFVFSAIGSSFAIKNSERFQDWFSKNILNRIGLRDEKDYKEAAPFMLHKDIAFLGFFRVASSMVETFRNYEVALGEKNLLDRSVVVDFNESVHDKLRAQGVTTVYGDIANMDTLHHIGIEDVKLVISTIPDSVLVGTNNAQMVEKIRSICPIAKVIATAETTHQALASYQAGADYVVVPRVLESEHLLPITNLLLEASEMKEAAVAEAAQLRESEMESLKSRLEVIE